MATVGARLRGVGLVIGVESVPDRQKLAHTYGAGEIVDFTSEDVVERILDLTRGAGVDTAIEALGADVTFQTAVKITKPGARSPTSAISARENSCASPGRVGRRNGRQGDRDRPVLWRQATHGATATGAGNTACRPLANDDS
ncbi:zinc-binding dehydrogenase [Streptomyces sp. NBC_01707]